MKKLIVFDLDGTLAESKSPLDEEMAALLCLLLSLIKVAIISGGDWTQFKKQILQTTLSQSHHLENLSLLPTCGTKFYQYSSGWKRLYSEDFTPEEKQSIINALEEVSTASGFEATEVWGKIIEDRGSKITFSALGQKAPLVERKKWDPDFTKRKAMQASLDQLIPGFSVQLGGTTSIDVTKSGIDKTYGIRKLREILGITIDKMFFVGNSLCPDRNDSPTKKAGVLSIQVRNPHETKQVVESIFASLDGPIEP
ncbi:HAD-IIB family hydrolase [Verrucomicrobiales bacterium]|jgi:phosphomannomutase|nr:HAD-IIB family hydrolase [Verrucomicrobiales bacterium]